MLSVIGCGNPNRCDDGVGSYVIQGLRQTLPSGPPASVRLFDAGTSGMQVMFEARGSDALIIVDATVSDGEPGALYEVPGSALETPHPEGGNLHDFRWQHALYAGRRMYGDAFPDDVSVYLIEAADLGLGLSLTPAVQAAADALIVRLASRITTRDIRAA